MVDTIRQLLGFVIDEIESLGTVKEQGSGDAENEFTGEILSGYGITGIVENTTEENLTGNIVLENTGEVVVSSPSGEDTTGTITTGIIEIMTGMETGDIIEGYFIKAYDRGVYSEKRGNNNFCVTIS